VEFGHPIRHEQLPEAREPPVLCFLGKDMTPLRRAAQQPRVIAIDAEAMSVPSDPLSGHKLKNTGFNRDTERFPSKPCTLSKVWGRALQEAHVG
jgi:hypothetical protein